MIAEELTKDYDGHIVFQDAHFTIEKERKSLSSVVTGKESPR